MDHPRYRKMLERRDNVPVVIVPPIGQSLGNTAHVHTEEPDAWDRSKGKPLWLRVLIWTYHTYYLPVIK